jgi:adenosylcobinamide-GDP ribazoletransferase
VIGALGFLSVIGRTGRRPTPGDLTWFPVVGALLGLGVGGAWWAAGELWTIAIAAALAVIADLVLTGMLHIDGLADSADGVLPHLPRERRLEVMATPDVGAFGVAVVGAVFLLRWAAFGSIVPDVLLVAGLWCASRTLMAVAVLSLPYARAEGGLASVFGGAQLGRARAVAVLGGALALGLAVFGTASPAVSVGAVAAGLAAGVAVLDLGRHRLGGYTGDLLGAAGVVCETVGLLVAAARW